MHYNKTLFITVVSSIFLSLFANHATSSDSSPLEKHVVAFGKINKNKDISYNHETISEN
jgi:hypothetical protein